MWAMARTQSHLILEGKVTSHLESHTKAFESCKLKHSGLKSTQLQSFFPLKGLTFTQVCQEGAHVWFTFACWVFGRAPQPLQQAQNGKGKIPLAGIVFSVREGTDPFRCWVSLRTQYFVSQALAKSQKRHYFTASYKNLILFPFGLVRKFPCQHARVSIVFPFNVSGSTRRFRKSAGLHC